MDIRYVAKRPFMLPGNPEPNEYYRPWLEKNIGEQREEWDWNLCRQDLNVLEFYFDKELHGVLFELSW